MAAISISPPTPVAGTLDGPLSGFHLVAVVFQRARQLQDGARPRVDAGEHKWTRLALLEVLADTVSWSVGEETAAPSAAPAPASRDASRPASRERDASLRGLPGDLPP